MSAHTPGPWKVSGATHIWSPSAKANIASCSALRTIKDVGYAPPELGDLDEVAANACLIAAAPDLLAACKQAIVELKGREHDGFLREAIAKAEGQS